MRTTAVAIEPGPARRGVASGTIATSSFSALGDARPGRLGAEHVEREEQQHHAARDLEGREADAEHAEERLAGDREADHQGAGGDRRAQRDLAAAGRVLIPGQGQEEGHRRERVHHEEDG
jgi:hypothetical protein